jgi:hypothetical protein
MTTREKILITLMIAAIGYGAFELLSATLFRDPAPETPASRVQDQSRLPGEVARVMEDGGLDPVRAYIFEVASMDWGRNFFYQWPPETEVTPQDPWMEEDIEPLTYSGYIEMGQRRLAIINNMEYQEGDMLARTGFRIMSISPGEVIIESVRGIRQTSIPYVEETHETAD